MGRHNDTPGMQPARTFFELPNEPDQAKSVQISQIQPVAGLRDRQAPPWQDVRGVQSDEPGFVADLLDLPDPASPVVPASALDDVLHRPGQHRFAAGGHRPQIARDLLYQCPRPRRRRVLHYAEFLVEHRVLVGLVEVAFDASGVGPGRARRACPEQLGRGQILQHDVLHIPRRQMLRVREIQLVHRDRDRVVVRRQAQLDPGHLLPAQRVPAPPGEIHRRCQAHHAPAGMRSIQRSISRASAGSQRPAKISGSVTRAATSTRDSAQDNATPASTSSASGVVMSGWV